MKQLFLEGYENYVNHMRTVIDDYDNHSGHGDRRRQCQTIIDSINEDFNFDKIVVLETGSSSSYNDGLFGLFLGYIAKQTNGKMISVDISSDIVEKSKKIFDEVMPELDYSVNVGDSVSFLTDLQEIPNLVHLDSWNFNLFDILPSALHGWEEFKAIESKMEKGSIIIIDDNYPKNTNLQWVYTDGRVEKTSVRYPMIGKGAHVYQHVLTNNTNWKLIGTHYDSPNNIKIIIQKK
jgi:hypothetical protein